MSRAALTASPVDAGTLTLPTPEGVALHFRIAAAGDRATAFLIDAVFILGLLLVVVAVGIGIWWGGAGEDGLLTAFLVLFAFLVQNFYFIWFETRAHGATPGKKRLGIRVMSSDGGSLTATAIVVRNVMRNLETLLPLVVMIDPAALWPDAPGWTRLLASAWLFVLLFMPLFNRQRLRVGDMVAGTVVVVAPRAVLLADLGHQRARRQATAAATFTFTDEQLDAYGAYELQVLEDVLRRNTGRFEGSDVVRGVAQRIAKKIRWRGRIPPESRRLFLLDFYTALRRRLEQKMLLGQRKQDKHDR